VVYSKFERGNYCSHDFSVLIATLTSRFHCVYYLFHAASGFFWCIREKSQCAKKPQTQLSRLNNWPIADFPSRSSKPPVLSNQVFKEQIFCHRVNEMWQRVLVIQFDYLFTLPLQLQMDIFTHATFITRSKGANVRESLKAKRGSAWIKQQLEFLLSSLQLHLSPARARWSPNLLRAWFACNALKNAPARARKE